MLSVVNGFLLILKPRCLTDQEIIPKMNKTNIVKIVTDETPTGNHTGAIHGTGIRKRTSIVVSFGGHFMRI